MIIYQHGTFWREGSPPREEPSVDALAHLERTPPLLLLPADIPDAPWWTGKRLACGFCTCVFGVETGDTLRTDCLVYAFAAKEASRAAQLRLSVNCPQCRLLNRLCESDAEESDPFDPPEEDGDEEMEDCS